MRAHYVQAVGNRQDSGILVKVREGPDIGLALDNEGPLDKSKQKL